MYGLGSVLLQKSPEGHWKPVLYASRAMTETERRYAQIEKEALAVTWACEKFANYIVGKGILNETDHKPLIPILNNKDLDTLPPRVVRFRLRIARFDYVAKYLPGKLLYTVDALSRAPIAFPDPSDQIERAHTEMLVQAITLSLPAQEGTLESFATEQSKDPTLSRVKSYCRSGWPARDQLDNHVLPYWLVKDSLTLAGNLLLYNRCVVIPPALWRSILEKIHGPHQGLQ